MGIFVTDSRKKSIFRGAEFGNCQDHDHGSSKTKKESHNFGYDTADEIVRTQSEFSFVALCKIVMSINWAVFITVSSADR